MNTNNRLALSPSVAQVEILFENMQITDEGTGGIYNVPPHDEMSLSEMLCDAFDGDPYFEATGEFAPMDIDTESQHRYGILDQGNPRSNSLEGNCSILTCPKRHSASPASSQVKSSPTHYRGDPIGLGDGSIQNNVGPMQVVTSHEGNLRVNSVDVYNVLPFNTYAEGAWTEQSDIEVMVAVDGISCFVSSSGTTKKMANVMVVGTTPDFEAAQMRPEDHDPEKLLRITSSCPRKSQENPERWSDHHITDHRLNDVLPPSLREETIVSRSKTCESVRLGGSSREGSPDDPTKRKPGIDGSSCDHLFYEGSIKRKDDSLRRQRPTRRFKVYPGNDSSPETCDGNKGLSLDKVPSDVRNAEDPPSYESSYKRKLDPLRSQSASYCIKGYSGIARSPGSIDGNEDMLLDKVPSAARNGEDPNERQWKHGESGFLNQEIRGSIGTEDEIERSAAPSVDMASEMNAGLEILTPLVEVVKASLLNGHQEKRSINTFSSSTGSAMISKTLGNDSQSYRRQAKGYPPVYSTTEDIGVNVEVCVVLDTRNKYMAKFSEPLRSNVARFWEILSVAKGNALRMSISTSTEKLDFTSVEDEFLSFASRIAFHDGDLGKEETTSPRVTTGLWQALAPLKKLGWSTSPTSSCKFVYLLTSLPGEWDDEPAKVELSGIVKELSHRLPQYTTLLVGCWRDDNASLLEATRSKLPFCKFSMLSLKEMVSCGFPDVSYKRSVSSIRGDTKVAFGKWQRVVPNFDAFNRSVASKATMTSFKPFKSMNEILSTDQSKVYLRSFRMQRGENKVEETRNLIISHVSVKDEKDVRTNILISCFKLDVFYGKTTLMSLERYKRQAYISAVSRFLANQYNKDHRPDHCAEVRFLTGGVIEELSKQGIKRSYYVELLPSSISIYAVKNNCKSFCDSEGIWNDEEVDETLLRFVLTCFNLSGGDVMVTGLKGIRRDNAIYLTAPSFLSKIGDPIISPCHAHYMKKCRVATRSLMDNRGWNLKCVKAGKASNPEKANGEQQKSKKNSFW